MNFYNIILAFSFQEIAIILLIVLLLFGGRKIPELMRGLGSGIKEFKNASKEEESSQKKGK
jgi:sec-independent protein translocase protein TatA